MDTLISRKTTQELSNEINIAKNVDVYIKQNERELDNTKLSEYLNRLLRKYKVTKSEVFKRAGMSDTNYGYEIFRGDKKNVSRDKLIQICMGFPLNCEEAQRVLCLSGAGTLYPMVQRDVCIMFALSNGYDLYMLNELLFEHGEKIII